MSGRTRSLFYRFRQCQEGSVAIVVGLTILVLILAAGAAIDMTRAQILRTKIQSALDSAGLAALASLSSVPNGTSKSDWATQQAQRYFTANFSNGYLGTSSITVAVTVANDGNSATLTASATQDTTLMSMMGVSSVSVSAHSSITRATSGQGMELVLALDNTGSMSCSVSDASDCTSGPNSKIVALKSAASSLLDIIYGSGIDSVEGLYVGVVPFSQTVNIGVNNKNFTYYSDPDNGVAGVDLYQNYDWGGTSWGGCVMERYWVDYEDPPDGYYGAFDAYWYPPQLGQSAVDGTFLRNLYGYYWNYNPVPATGTIPKWRIKGWADYTTTPTTYLSPLNTTTQGPNLDCPVPVVPLVASRSVVQATIDNMQPVGDTVIPEGVAWAWRVLSPKWRGLWDGVSTSLPLDYGVTYSRKVVVLMSDGWNHFQPYNFTAYGWMYYMAINFGLSQTRSDVEAAANYITLDICDGLKNNGVEVYTIGFGNAGTNSNQNNTVNQDLLSQCATPDTDPLKPHFFLAPTNSDLQKAFVQIAQQLIQLRVSQ